MPTAPSSARDPGDSVKVLVTGGSGGLGRWVVRELLAHGYEVVSADRRPPKEAEPRAHYAELDLTSVRTVEGALRGCGAVVHLAAIPAPGARPDEEVFGTNVRTTFAVFQAARTLGVGRVVAASSTAALGAAFAPRPFGPRYLPIDEAHPLSPQDPYALSKEVGERVGAAFGRSGMSVLALRFHFVAQPGVAAARAGEFRLDSETCARELGGYVDVRDAARACRLGLEADTSGFEAFNITAADTLSRTPTLELVRHHYPEVELRGPLEGFASAWSTEKARRLLGYAPRYSWREEEETA